jgi:hypothetical protein
MTATLNQAQRFAQLKKTKVIAHKVADDHQSITFVLESGPKLTMTGEELSKEIATMEKAIAREQAILAIDNPEPKKAKEAKPDSRPARSAGGTKKAKEPKPEDSTPPASS